MTVDNYGLCHLGVSDHDMANMPRVYLVIHSWRHPCLRTGWNERDRRRDAWNECVFVIIIVKVIGIWDRSLTHCGLIEWHFYQTTILTVILSQLLTEIVFRGRYWQ